jgi:hypothetical protein
VLAGSGFIATRNECCEGGSTAGLGDYPQGLPEGPLGTLDRFVGNQGHVVNISLGDGVHERADATGCERETIAATAFEVAWSSSATTRNRSATACGPRPRCIGLPGAAASMATPRFASVARATRSRSTGSIAGTR